MLGITKHRYLYEIEIKRSMSDFYANSRKRHIQLRDLYPERVVKRYWFMAYSSLAIKMQPLLPLWAGLLSVDPNGCGILELVSAPVDPASKRLSVKECVQAVRLMANQFYKLVPYDCPDEIRWNYDPH